MSLFFGEFQRHKFKKSYKIKEGDVFFIYSNDNGIIAVGYATGELKNNDPQKIGYKLKCFLVFKKRPLTLKDIKDKFAYSMNRAIPHAIFRIHNKDVAIKIHNYVIKEREV